MIKRIILKFKHSIKIWVIFFRSEISKKLPLRVKKNSKKYLRRVYKQFKENFFSIITLCEMLEHWI